MTSGAEREQYVLPDVFDVAKVALLAYDEGSDVRRNRRQQTSIRFAIAVGRALSLQPFSGTRR